MSEPTTIQTCATCANVLNAGGRMLNTGSWRCSAHPRIDYVSGQEHMLLCDTVRTVTYSGSPTCPKYAAAEGVK